MKLVEAVTFLLGLQFLLGMYLNLYGINGSLMDNLILGAHIAVAFAMVGATGASFFLAIKIDDLKKGAFMIGLSLLSIIIAGAMGLVFLYYGQSNVSSYLMAVFFLIAYGFVGYAGGVMRRPHRTAQQ